MDLLTVKDINEAYACPICVLGYMLWREGCKDKKCVTCGYTLIKPVKKEVKDVK